MIKHQRECPDLIPRMSLYVNIVLLRMADCYGVQQMTFLLLIGSPPIMSFIVNHFSPSVTQNRLEVNPSLSLYFSTFISFRNKMFHVTIATETIRVNTASHYSNHRSILHPPSISHRCHRQSTVFFTARGTSGE